MLVRFNEVSKSFGPFPVLDKASFQINYGDKIGLVGANGSGKTTLLGLIDSPEEADDGQVIRTADLRTGRIEQHHAFGSRAVLDEALASFDFLRDLSGQLRALELQMSVDRSPTLLAQYAERQHEFEDSGGYTYRARTEAVLTGLGFRTGQFEQAAGTLSGGEQNRLALANLLLRDSDLLLLDEPTNHLDLTSIQWLEDFLQNTDQTMLLVSHDRYFLDRIVNRILELEGGQLHVYSGNYSSYLAQRTERRQRARREWQKQQEWIDRTEDYIRRNIAGQSTRQAQSRRKALEKLERLERPLDSPTPVRFRFTGSDTPRRHVLSARNLSIGFPSRTPLLAQCSLSVEGGQRWAIMGPNGSGKTTLLTTLIGRRKPLSGHLERFETDVGYYDQSLSELEGTSTVLEELRSLDMNATDGALRSFLAGFRFSGDTVNKKTSDLSGGEQSRLALARIIYTAPPLLALDEPTNHLDIASRESLESALIAYPGTLLFVTHDRRLVERVATHILYLASGDSEVFASLSEVEDRGIPKRTPPVSTRVRQERQVPSARLSKNQAGQIRKKIETLESRIEETELEIHQLEQMFQSPPGDFAWAEANTRHSDLRQTAETLYSELDAALDLSESEDTGAL